MSFVHINGYSTRVSRYTFDDIVFYTKNNYDLRKHDFPSEYVGYVTKNHNKDNVCMALRVYYV
jgi:hypothetical protein